MYQPLPSTGGSAAATIGKKSVRTMHKDLSLVRESDSLIVVKYGEFQIAAYNPPAEKLPRGSVTVIPDQARCSAVLSALNQILAATGAVIAEAPKSAQSFLAASGVDHGGWFLFAPGQPAIPFPAKGATLPIL